MGMSIGNISRRTLLKGAALGGAGILSIGLLSGCTHKTSGGSSNPMLVDASAGTNILDSFEYAEKCPLKQGASWNIALGSLIRPSSSEWMALTAPGDTSAVMTKACAFSSTSGTTVDVLASPLREAPTIVFYDVRCSDQVYAWIEIDMASRDWQLYAQAFAAGKLSGKPVKLAEGDANFDPPAVVCAGNRVIWQVVPSLSGTKKTEFSYCYLWTLGSDSAKKVVESQGRFAMPPCISGNTITLAPRVNVEKGVYYGCIAYSLEDNMATQLDQLVLPQSVKPFRAVKIGDKFAFSIEANYSSGGLLSKMGTYIGTSSGPFLVIPREPAAAVCGKDGRYLIKSTASYIVVDENNKTYSILPAMNRSLDYGEYPAREGETAQFVTFATVKNPDTGYPASVCVRAFSI